MMILQKTIPLAVLAASLSAVSAATISFNFAGGRNDAVSDVTELAVADSVGAGAYVAANWNNLKSDWSGTAGAVPGTIVDSTAVATGITLSFDTGDTWNTDLNEADSTDHKLFKRYFDDAGPASGQPYVNVSGITDAALGYTVVIYLASDAANAGSDVQMGDIWLQDQQADAGAMILSNGGAKLAPMLLGDSYTGSYIDATSGTAGNYIVFAGLTSTDFTLRGDKSATGARVGFAGMQIITVPEPSSAAMLGLAGLALIFRRRK